MQTRTRHDDDDFLVDYVSRALEMRERGEEPELGELCAAHPHLIARVTDMIARAPGLQGLAASAQEFDALQGRVLAGRYRLDARLGAGAMGIVYRAFDTQLNRAVAVKVLRPELFGGRDSEKRFLREAQVLAALRHPNVVAVFDRGSTHDGVSFLVMELLRGQPLVALLAEHTKRVESNGSAALDDMGFVAEALDQRAELESTWLRQAVRWTADLARGLGEAHRLGILHRDIKPSNVFITSDGSASLLDFGVAASSAHATLTASNGTTPGTPAYMAPEVLGEHAPDAPPADVYGLAATLYHLLSRRPPYAGTLTQIIARLQRTDPIAIGKLRPGLPQDLHAIIDRGMARRVSERYATMAEFESDLRAFLDHRPVKARPLSAIDRVWRRARRSPGVKVVATIGLLLLVAGSVVLWRKVARERRQTRYDGAIAQLPPGLTVERPAFRRIVNEAERAALRSLLDAAVENASDPIPSRLLRAAFLLDQGEAAASADDIAALVETDRTDFATKLAERYRVAAQEQPMDAPAVDVTGLPTPVSLRDCYLLAYHLLRAGANPAANDQIIAWLEGADATWLPAQEMLASAFNFRAHLLRHKAPAMSHKFASMALGTAGAVETRRGLRTATTAHIVSTSLLALARFPEAAVVASQGIELSPWSMGLLLSQSRLHRRMGNWSQAIEACERAIKLRPGHPDSFEIMAGVHVDCRDFASARATMESVRSRAALSEADYHRVAGMMEYLIAIAELADDRRAMAVDPARRAIEHFKTCGDTQRLEYHVSAAVAERNDSKLAELLLSAWTDDPTSWHTSINVANILSARASDARGDRDASDTTIFSILAGGFHNLASSQSPSRPLPVTPAPAARSPSPDTPR